MSEAIEETVKNFVEWANSEFGCDLSIDGIIDDVMKINASGKGHIYISLDTGEVKTQLTGPLPDKLREALGHQTAKPPAIQDNDRKRAVVPSMSVRGAQVSELTLEDIKNYICPAATDQEAYMFLQLCQARSLNPFTGEVFLIKYGQKAQMVVGKEAFMRKAEMHPAYDGFRAGVIVESPEIGELDYREGSFVKDGEVLLGGWCVVFRKDRSHPVMANVSIKDYDTGRDGPWKTHKPTMIRKVAVVQAHREAFPSDLSGCYDAAEFREAEEMEA